MNNGNQMDTPTYLPSDGIVSVVLVCPSPLERISLQTAINAIPTTVVVAKSAGTEMAIQLIQKHTPDILLADAYSLRSELSQLLKLAGEMRPDMIRVVLLPGPAHEQGHRPPDADFVLYQGNLTQQFTEVIDWVKARRGNDAQAD